MGVTIFLSTFECFDSWGSGESAEKNACILFCFRNSCFCLNPFKLQPRQILFSRNSCFCLKYQNATKALSMYSRPSHFKLCTVVMMIAMNIMIYDITIDNASSIIYDPTSLEQCCFCIPPDKGSLPKEQWAFGPTIDIFHEKICLK